MGQPIPGGRVLQEKVLATLEHEILGWLLDMRDPQSPPVRYDIREPRPEQWIATLRLAVNCG